MVNGGGAQAGMLSEEGFDSIVDAIYEAALDPKQWAAVVDITTRAFDAVGASIFTPFVEKFGLEPLWSTNADPEFIANYASKWGQTDPLLPHLLRRIPSPAFVYRWDDLISRQEYEAWDGYADILRQHVRQGVGLMVNTDGHRAGQLMVYTWEIEGPRVEELKRGLKRLERHFQRALQVHWHLTEARRTAAMATLTLDMFRTGAAWLSATGELLYTNSEMDAVIAKRDGIYATNGVLTFWIARPTRRWRPRSRRQSPSAPADCWPSARPARRRSAST